MGVVEVWLIIVVLSSALGLLASIRSTCLELIVGTNGKICRKKMRWVEWGDVVPKSGIAMILLGGSIWAYWGIRELLLERGLKFTELEAVIEYHTAWGAFLAFATGVVILSIYLLTRPLRE